MTKKTARQEILDRLKESTPRSKTKRAGKKRKPSPPPHGREKLIEAFTEKAVVAGAVVQRVKTPGAAAKAVSSFMKDENFSSALLSDHTLITEASIEKKLTKDGTAVHPFTTDTTQHRQLSFSCDVGITGVDYGIAETGSLALVIDKKSPRLTSLAPPGHIALMRTTDIVANTEELFSRIRRRDKTLPTVILITGPSLTADIALTSVRGIHGPGKLFIVLMG
jgi:L-lactate dehydrogenase complex protein LldG